MHRRDFLQRSSAVLLAAGFGGSSFTLLARSPAKEIGAHWNAQLTRLERDSGGRLGVAALDTGDGKRLGWRGGERFPMCSTFKFLLAAAVLREVDRGRLDLQRKLPIAKSDIIAHSPTTEPLVGVGASVATLCEATMTLSDNAAANLLLPLIGGPAGLTRFLRSIGDPVTRLDRIEPELNVVGPGDERDTTSPDAMLDSLRTLVLGDALKPASRERLTAWLVANKTGDKRLRAGLPAGLRVGDKTGTANTTANDLAAIWPAAPRKPVLLTCYLTGAGKIDAAGRDQVHAEVARTLAQIWL
ncbi:class A beta-lactamase [Lysobacter antibioticus]|uniref:class A beta-lactamase n=1 Tax=Lysobacter antibioticus TaxID=84531 RepID=UPI0003466829|nr:class A beta-lactamase [Lysobacter antibioticus]